MVGVLLGLEVRDACPSSLLGWCWLECRWVCRGLRTSSRQVVGIPRPPTRPLALYHAIWDINFRPTRTSLLPAPNFVLQKRRLQHLTSRDGKAEFHSWVTAAERSVLEVFQEFPSIKVPFEHLVQLLPRLAPRSYTICSSSVVTPNTVHLAVSVVQTVSARVSACLV